MSAQTAPKDLAWLQTSTSATVTVADTAQVLEVDDRTVIRAIAADQLPSVRVGRRVLVPRVPLLRLLTDGAGGEAA